MSLWCLCQGAWGRLHADLQELGHDTEAAPSWAAGVLAWGHCSSVLSTRREGGRPLCYAKQAADPTHSQTSTCQPTWIPLLTVVLSVFYPCHRCICHIWVRLGCFGKPPLWLSAYYLQNSSLDSFYKYYMQLHKTLWGCLLTSAYFIWDHRVCCYSAWPWKEASALWRNPDPIKTQLETDEYFIMNNAYKVIHLFSPCTAHNFLQWILYSNYSQKNKYK